uniref:ABC-2 type transporter transmembrane domain-containing protein n=1 Tax=Hemiselmis andersenii TaxID=464988 RepID=A0A7S1GRE1_HEMAN
MFYGVGLNQRSVQDRTGALYFVLTTQIFSAQASMRVFLEERDLFLRERIAGTYRTSAYFWSKSIADTPLQLLFALIFSAMSYYFVGLQPGLLHVLKYCLTIVITTLAAESYVIMVGAWVPDDKTAAILGPVAFALMSLFGGFFLNIDSLPFFVSWLQYLSLFKYSFAAIMQNEFRGLKFTCDGEDRGAWLESLDDSTKAHVEEFIHLIPCPTPDGETHLHRLKLDQVAVWPCIAILVLMAVGFRVLGFVALRRRSRKLMSGQQRERKCPVLPRNRGAKKPADHPKQE